MIKRSNQALNSDRFTPAAHPSVAVATSGPVPSGDTHCVGFGLLPRGPAGGNHGFHDGHPALFVWETGSQEVERLSGPAGGVAAGLQLQDVWNI